MNVLSFEVTDLLKRGGTFQATLKPDLNILTGRNGAGKTSIIKLIWYVMSGNIELALREVAFSHFRLVTTLYDVTIQRLGPITCKIDLNINGKEYTFNDITDSDGDVFEDAEDQANPHLISSGSSVLFPTFRRIEGGFTLGAKRAIRSSSIANRSRSDIEDGLITLSKRLTNENHVFVSSISTADIVGLLLTQYASLSQEYSVIQQNVSESIIQKIKTHKADHDDQNKSGIEANKILDEIRSKIESMETEREDIMSPIETVGNLIEKLFRHTGINFGPKLNFGDAANAVNSDVLSAGEKQMLSFICYNAFNKDAVIFIDEPELSLHVDWQRQIFPILLRQQTSNQFIIATHSPFIYGKYPDKEVAISLDRGDAESA